MKTMICVIGLLFGLNASAGVSAQSTGAVRGLPGSETFALTVSGSSSYKANAEEVATRIRQGIYRQRLEIVGWTLTESNTTEAIKFLSDLEQFGEAGRPRYTNRHLSNLSSWIEDKKVARVYRLELETKYMAGSASDTVFIFLPSSTIDPVLTIAINTYTE